MREIRSSLHRATSQKQKGTLHFPPLCVHRPTFFFSIKSQFLASFWNQRLIHSTLWNMQNSQLFHVFFVHLFSFVVEFWTLVPVTPRIHLSSIEKTHPRKNTSWKTKRYPFVHYRNYSLFIICCYLLMVPLNLMLVCIWRFRRQATPQSLREKGFVFLFFIFFIIFFL